MLKRIIQTWLFLLAVVVGHAQSLQLYEYWVDSDYSKHTTVRSSEADITFQMDVSQLPKGVHYLNFRAQNSENEWGTISRYLFYIPEDSHVDATLTHYQYWIDNDFSGQVTTATSRGDITLPIDISNLTAGVHYFNFRACNSDGIWGSLSQYLFYVPEKESAAPTLTHYQYWIDNDFSGQVTTATSSGDITPPIDISDLSSGVHYFNFRACNSDGVWGNLNRYLFYVPESESTALTLSKAQYWFDDDFASNITQNATENFFASIDVSQLESGVHYFNYRACNSDGVWGNLNRYLFYIPESRVDTNNPIVGFRYNFNNRYTYVPLSNRMDYEMSNYLIDVPELTEMGSLEEGCTYNFDVASNTVHFSRTAQICFAMQFKNTANEWSAPATTQFEMQDAFDKPMSELQVQRQIEMEKVPAGDFLAFYMNIEESRNYFLKSSQSCTIRLYDSNGSLLTTIQPEALRKTYQIGLTKSIYYGIVYYTIKDEENPADVLTLKLMLTDNIVPTPAITYEQEMVTMSCAEPTATIYYTLDGTDPTRESTHYNEPFSLKHNAMLKAVAVAQDMADSDIATLTVNSYKVETPTIEFTNLKLYMACQTEGVAIYYTLDGSDPAMNGQRYMEPVAITNNCTAKAVGKRDGYNNSEIAVLVVDVSNVKTSTPQIEREGNGLHITCRTEGATLHYTTDGTTPTTSSPIVNDGFLLPQLNGTVNVIAMKDGELPSDVASIEVDWLQVDMPILSYDVESCMLTMTCATPGATIYYVIGEGMPSVVYTNPIVLTDNRTVTAVAKASDLLDSEPATYNPISFTCEPVTFSFDGHELRLSCATEGATIFYTTDGTQPSSNSIPYQGKLLINDIVIVKAIAMKPNTNSSALTAYTIPAYYNGRWAEVGTPGEMSQAFGWCKTEDIEELQVKGALNNNDLATLRMMHSLKHLDMSAVMLSDGQLPEKAFHGMSLVSIIVPEKLTGAGSSLFEDCRQLAAIVWQTDFRLTEQMLQGVDNPNLLVYVKLKSDAPTSVNNVVVNGRSNSITLSDQKDGNNNFYCPVAFIADRISYQHNYQQQTVIGECRGWETLALPFNVETITHQSRGLLTPFAVADKDSRPFWLCRLSTDGFIETGSIEANTPYIISMPNNSSYADQYILGGTVTFAAQNARVYASSELVTDAKGEFTFVPCFTVKSKDDGVLPLNVQQSFDGFPEGSNFFRNLQRDVRPFEAYILASSTNARRFSISEETTDVYELIAAMQTSLRVYDLAGHQLYSGPYMNAWHKQLHLKPGVYIVNGKKVLIK